MVKLLCHKKAMDILGLNGHLKVENRAETYQQIHEEEVARIFNIWKRCNLAFKDILWVTEPQLPNRNLEYAIISHFISESTHSEIDLTARDFLEIISKHMLEDMRVNQKIFRWKLKRRMQQESAMSMLL